MAILNARPRSATAVVRTPARLLVIEGKTFEAMLRARPEIALRIIKTLAMRLESANQQVELLLLPTPNHRVVQCLRQFADEQIRSRDARQPGHRDPRAEAGRGHRGARRPAGPRGDRGRRSPARLAPRAARRGAGIEGDGFIVPEVGRLLEFLEFLNLKDRFGP